MAKLFKTLKAQDYEDELDLEFEIAENFSYEFPPDKENNQMLAVWGSPGSGKTIVATKIARYIASRKKNVVLLFADMYAPPLSFICPRSDLETENSLGNILGCAGINEHLVKQNAVLHKKNEYLTMFGMLNGENAFSYPPYSEAQIKDFLAELRKMAMYIIIDCTSVITNDMLSAVSLIESDVVLRLASCDLKAVSYLNSQTPVLLDNKFNMNKQLKAVSDVDSFQADDTIEQAIGGVNFKIPHSAEVKQQFLMGNLFGALTQNDSKEFRKAISKISNEVFLI